MAMTSMSTVIDTRPEDLPRLEAFFRQHAEARVPHLDLSSLRWKYFDEFAIAKGPASVIAEVDRQIVSHIGLCQTQFHRGSLRISACHFIDWVGTAPFPFMNLRVIKSRFGRSDVQYSIGGSEIAQSMLPRLGFQCLALLPVYAWETRNPLRWGGPRTVYGSLRDQGRWLVKRALYRAAASRAPLSLRLVSTLQPGGLPGVVTDPGSPEQVISDRSDERLNYLLRCPCAEVVAHEVVDPQDQRVGRAIVALMHRDRCTAKIVDCQLNSRDPGWWNTTLQLLRCSAVERGARSVSMLATTPWAIRGCQDAGMRPLEPRRLFVRDPRALLPLKAIYDFSYLDADLGYRP